MSSRLITKTFKYPTAQAATGLGFMRKYCTNKIKQWLIWYFVYFFLLFFLGCFVFYFKGKPPHPSYHGIICRDSQTKRERFNFHVTHQHLLQQVQTTQKWQNHKPYLSDTFSAHAYLGGLHWITLQGLSHHACRISFVTQGIHAILSNVDSPGTLELPYTTHWDNHFQGEMGMRVLF